MADVLTKSNIGAASPYMFLTSKVSSPVPVNWVKIHPLASKRAIQHWLPSGQPFTYVDMSGDTVSQISSNLPSNCSIIRINISSIDEVILHESYTAARADRHVKSGVAIFGVQNPTTSTAIAVASRYITNWSTVDSVQADILPLNTAGMFSNDKTYLLAGMTGDLGLSLSRWMVQNGARHIVLTSRNANVDQRWLDDMLRQNATINVVQTDMTDRAAVQGLVKTIDSTMPPIAGVCNACMILSDKLFVDMDTDALEKVLKPKVDAAIYLDEEFRDTPLDFLIMLSSVASVIGNAGESTSSTQNFLIQLFEFCGFFLPDHFHFLSNIQTADSNRFAGQSNYHAANLFMTGLAAQRRFERGQAASVIHIGFVADVGYVTRQPRAVEDRLRNLFFMPLTESDIHHSFAEAILAEKPDSGRQHELILGVQSFVDSDSVDPCISRPPWEHNPRFSHFIAAAPSKADKKLAANDSEGVANIKQLLREAESQESVIKLVQDAFCRKLEKMMQMVPNSVDVNVPLIDMGCDSLLAIEVRAWFLKELGMDVPILKVLSGDIVAELCDNSTKKFFASRLIKGRPEIEVTTEKPTVSEEGSAIDTESDLGSSQHVSDDNSGLDQSISSLDSAGLLSFSTSVALPYSDDCLTLGEEVKEHDAKLTTSASY